MVSDDGAKDPKLVDSAGAAAAEGALVDLPLRRHHRHEPGRRDVRDRLHRRRSDAAPGTYSAEAYDAANVILQAHRRRQDDGKDINDYLTTVNYKGLTKTYKFDTKGEVSAPPSYVYGVKGGKVAYDGSVDQLIGG